MAILGTKGDDFLVGGRGDNVIFGRGGWDRISGKGGDDILDGGAGSDIIRGGAGRDSIWGGKGLDELTGGRGADNFWFDTRHSYDIITDFRSNDALIIDVSEGAFEGVRLRDVSIRHRADFDRIFVDGDLVAEVYGVFVTFDDIFLIS